MQNNQSSNNKALIHTLVNMIKSDSTYFDEGIASYIVDRLPSEEIENKEIPLGSFSNHKINTNIIGLYHHQNSYRLNKENDEENQKMIDKWAALLSKKIDINKLENPVYVVKKNKIEDTISKIGLMALNNLESYLKIYEQEPIKYSLTPEEKIVLVEDWLQENPNSSFYNKDDIKLKFIVETLNNNIEFVKKRNKYDDDNVVSKILSSKLLKFVISAADKELTSQLFPMNALNSIIKKSNLKENLKTVPNMLSNLLPLAPPENWIIAGSKGNIEEFNFLIFFRPQFTTACGCNITEIQGSLTASYDWHGIIYDRYKRVSRMAIREFTSRLNYLEPFLKTTTLEDKERCLLYTMVTLSGDENLYKQVRNIYSLPDQLSNYSKFFYEKLYIAPIYSNDRKSTKTFMDVEKEYQIEKLYNKIEETSTQKMETGKRVKI